MTRRRFVGTLIGAGLAGSLRTVWRWETPFPRECVVRPVCVPAPAPWRGRCALFVTDIHYGNLFGPSETIALNALVRARRPSVVLMGGDFGDTPDTDLTGFFANWSPGCPTLFAPGNHDVAEHRLSSPVLSQAGEGGMTVLNNAAERWNGLAFVGLPSAFRAPARTSLLELPGPKLVLGHEPDMWDRYLQADLVQLAGHTHGGQVCVWGRPLILPLLGRKYVHGNFFRARNNSLIVSSGVGCRNPHVRIDCPPEIVELLFV